MGRKRRKIKRHYRQWQRGISDIRRAKRLLSRPQSFITSKIPSVTPKAVAFRMARKILHDRRLYRPFKFERYLLYGPKDKISRVALRDRTVKGKPYRTTPRQGFIDPKRQEVCKRRRRRRELLFRRQKVGRGVAIRTPKHFNPFSKMRC